MTQAPPSISHISERLGLFIIIVLGESVVAVVRGVTDREWSTGSILTAGLGLSLAFSLWWIYFDLVDSSPLQAVKLGRPHISLLWLYIHLPLAVGLTAIGVGVEHVASKEAGITLLDTERWLFCGAVALWLTTLAAINQMTCSRRNRHCWTLGLYQLGGAVLILTVAANSSRLSALTLVALTTAICVVQVFLGLKSVSKCH